MIQPVHDITQTGISGRYVLRRMQHDQHNDVERFLNHPENKNMVERSDDSVKAKFGDDLSDLAVDLMDETKYIEIITVIDNGMYQRAESTFL